MGSPASSPCPTRLAWPTGELPVGVALREWRGWCASRTASQGPKPCSQPCSSGEDVGIPLQGPIFYRLFKEH